MTNNNNPVSVTYTDANTKDHIINAMVHEFEDVKTLMGK